MCLWIWTCRWIYRLVSRCGQPTKLFSAAQGVLQYVRRSRTIPRNQGKSVLRALDLPKFNAYLVFFYYIEHLTRLNKYNVLCENCYCLRQVMPYCIYAYYWKCQSGIDFVVKSVCRPTDWCFIETLMCLLTTVSVCYFVLKKFVIRYSLLTISSCMLIFILLFCL